MNSVNASHILVKTEAEALDILHKLVSKEISFEDAARQFSFCPSKRQGGNLGNFQKGMMVPEFEEVCFNEKNKVSDIVGPIKTEFGFHLIKINQRN